MRLFGFEFGRRTRRNENIVARYLREKREQNGVIRKGGSIELHTNESVPFPGPLPVADPRLINRFPM